MEDLEKFSDSKEQCVPSAGYKVQTDFFPGAGVNFLAVWLHLVLEV